MKICFYSVTAARALGGLETYIWELGRELAGRGHEVTVVAGEGGQGRYPAIRLVQFPFRAREAFPGLPNIRPGFRQRYRKLAERLSFGLNAGTFLERGDFDVVVVTKPFDFPALWRARRRGMKAVIVFSSGGKDCFVGDRLFAKAIDYWISCSRSNADDIESRFRCRCHVVPYGVDTALFSPIARNSDLRRRHRIPADAKLLMTVGRLVHWKGVQLVIEAVAGVRDAHLAVAGDGPYRGRLEQLAESVGVADRVHFLGPIQHRDLPRVLAAADIFTQPSIGNEAFGITLIEAMACAVPVLGSDRGGIAEVIDHGVTGVVLPSGDIDAWRDAIDRLVADDNLRRSLGVAGRVRVEHNFTWSISADRFESVLGARPLAGVVG